MTEDFYHNNEKKNNPDNENKILHHASHYKVPYSLTEEEAYRLLQSKINFSALQVKKNTSGQKRLLMWTISIAASLFLAAGLGFLLWRSAVTRVVAAKGQHMEYRLPDGTNVSINADSKISIQKNTFLKNRMVKMEGEVFFNVKKGNAFTINTPLADIKVLGTSFNVFARDSLFRVSCFTGKIQVTSNDQTLFIMPGETAELQHNHLTKFSDKTISTVSKWRKGEFYFEYTPLNIVFDEIERQYNVNFVVEKMDKKFFTGSFTNKNLVDALDIVCIPMGLTYEIGSNSKIFIRERPR